MFTGIVEEIGQVVAIDGDPAVNVVLTIAAQTALEGARLGDSIAINGTCLTITAFDARQFSIGLSPETLRRTNLGALVPGSPVNLERSLAFGGRMGGHYVQGHVDGVGVISAIVPDGDSLRITVQPPASLLPFIVEKGYIAVDGVSLTIAALDDAGFTIAMIPYTRDAVIMGRQPVGTPVNLEVDIIAKYVERLTRAHRREEV
jgi:riboflavin synthase